MTLKLENARQSNNSITSLRSESGEIFNSNAKIMKEATHCYTELHTCKNLQHNDMGTFLDEIGETKKLAVDKNSCESEITLEDYESAISTICDNKSPGNDGLGRGP